jgi:hypothetical protein
MAGVSVLDTRVPAAESGALYSFEREKLNHLMKEA